MNIVDFLLLDFSVQIDKHPAGLETILVKTLFFNELGTAVKPILLHSRMPKKGSLLHFSAVRG